MGMLRRSEACGEHDEIVRGMRRLHVAQAARLAGKAEEGTTHNDESPEVVQ